MRNSVQSSGVLVLALGGLFGCHTASPPSQAQHSEVTPYVRRDAGSSANRIAPQGPMDPVTPPPADPAPGTAQALAQRAATYAQAVGPVTLQRHEKARPTNTAWPDPDAMRLTPQADIDPPKAVANSDLSKADSAAATSPVPNASMDLRTVHKLVVPDPSPDAARPTAGPAAADALAGRIASRARDYPADLSAQLDDQLAKYLRDDTVPDMSTLAGLAPEDREMLGAMMDAMSNFRSQLRADNNMLLSKKIRPLVELSDRLRSQAELSVPTVALCTAVHAYGVYDPMDPARFIAGTRQEAIVYCEVENFLSQPNDKNLYETRLTQNIVLYTESSGLPVWSAPKDRILDQARRRRHDFFLGKRVLLPSNLTIGRYLLKVTIEDQQAHHIAENTVPVEIVAQ
jgi:hypothetical protein